MLMTVQRGAAFVAANAGESTLPRPTGSAMHCAPLLLEGRLLQGFRTVTACWSPERRPTSP